MIDWFGPIIHEYYAGTEANGFVYCNSADWLAHPGTVGKPIIGAVHVCDDEFGELPVGETGTIWFEGTRPFEYHNDPAKTATLAQPAGLDDARRCRLPRRRRVPLSSPIASRT